MARHGFAVAALVSQLQEQGIVVDVKYRASTEAVAALARREFEKAAAAKYRPWLNPGQHELIHLAFRNQGIFVAKGNPKQINGLADLACVS